MEKKVNMNKRREEVKALGWVAIKLTAQRFRGAVYAHGKMGIYFTLEDCFIVKDELGYYSPEDIKYGLYDRTVPQQDLPYVEGRKTLGWINEKGEVEYAEDTLGGIDASEKLREEIKIRLKALNEFNEEIAVNLANVAGLASV